MKIVVVGGSGFVGRNIIPHLAKEHSVSYISRSENKKLKSIGVQWIKGNITNENDLKIIGEFDIVIDLVAVINEKEQKHEDVNVKGMENILKNAGNSRIVYFSAMNADNAKTKYFITKRKAEEMLIKRGNYIILRPSIIFGEDDYLTQMLINLKMPFIPKSGKLCPVYVEDIANILMKVINKEGIFEISGPDDLTLKDMFDIIRKINGKGRSYTVPDFLVKMLSPFLPITKEQLTMLSLDFCKGKEIFSELNIKPSRYEETMRKLFSR
ncbi:MAG: NAD-dependent epimerase/dehydratase family protein [Thermoplasmata archaeon]|nr:NAD(P)H-binding protein [Thermoplasmata archaeon]